MIESKLWHNKTEIKNVKVAKMVEFIKTCEKLKKYSREINILRVHRNIKGCILEVNFEVLGW